MNQPEANYVLVNTSHDVNHYANYHQPEYPVLGDIATTLPTLELAIERAAENYHFDMDAGELTIYALVPVEITEDVHRRYLPYCRTHNAYNRLHPEPLKKRVINLEPAAAY